MLACVYHVSSLTGMIHGHRRDGASIALPGLALAQCIVTATHMAPRLQGEVDNIDINRLYERLCAAGRRIQISGAKLFTNSPCSVHHTPSYPGNTVSS